MVRALCALALLCVAVSAGADPVANCRLKLEQRLDQELQALIVAESETPLSNASEVAPDESATSDDDEGLPLEEQLIGEVCSAEVDSVLAHPWASRLVRGRQSLRLVDLEAFYAQLDYYVMASPLRPLSEGDLEPILAMMDAPAQEPVSLWQRFVQWLVDWWGDGEDADAEWLEELLPSERTLKAIFYVSVALVILLAIVIVGTEARVALRHRRDSADVAWETSEGHSAQALSLSTLRERSPAEQPGLLLQWLLERLKTMGMDGWRGSQTHREIETIAASLPETQGGVLARITREAERATYGGWVPSDAEIDALIEHCQRAVAPSELRGRG